MSRGVLLVQIGASKRAKARARGLEPAVLISLWERLLLASHEENQRLFEIRGGQAQAHKKASHRLIQ